MKGIYLQVSDELHKALKVAVAKKQRSIKAVVVELIERWLEDRKSERIHN